MFGDVDMVEFCTNFHRDELAEILVNEAENQQTIMAEHMLTETNHLLFI
jgi:hypothetical protein